MTKATMQTADRAILHELLDRYGKEKGNAVLLPPGIRDRMKFTTLTPWGNMQDCSWVGFDLQFASRD